MHKKKSHKIDFSTLTDADLARLANELAKRGRGDDTMVAHINDEEAQMLKAQGGSGAVNPYTGLIEFEGGDGGGDGGGEGGGGAAHHRVGGLGGAWTAHHRVGGEASACLSRV